MKRTRSFFDMFIRRGPSSSLKETSALPVSRPVEIFRDAYGIPHIFAQSSKDSMIAQGFVHAQDRLFQMETIRRLASGTLSEISGESTAELDHFALIAGFHDIRRRQIAALAEEQRELLGAYADGINGYLSYAGKDLPIEFKKLNIEPQPWAVDDLAGSLAINAWFLQSNYVEEILAVVSRDRVTEEMWNELFGSSPGENLPEEDFFTKFHDVQIGPLLPAALAFYSSLGGITGASNNWVVADGPGGKPLLANDPHLDSGVPPIWYFCHLHSPEFDIAGASFPGMPGIIIGRNEHTAWGLTNVMTDCCDLYIVTVNPDHPTTYYTVEGAKEMEQIEKTIPIRNGGNRKVTIYRTEHGPVLTEVTPGVEAVVALKWYGTLSDDELEDTTLQGTMEINTAASVEELFKKCEKLTTVGQNVVAADSGGTVGWYACGSIPLRSGYSGRLPADGSSGENRWDGFVPPEKNPSVLNPAGRTIITANQKTVDESYPFSITYSWASPYRYERISELLKLSDTERGIPRGPGSSARESGEASDRYSVSDFKRIHADVFSKRADHYLPVILQFSYKDRAAREAAVILEEWDRRMTEDSIGGLLFQVFLCTFTELLLQDLLGEGFRIYAMFFTLFYSALDHCFDGAVDGKAPSSQVLGTRSLEELCEETLKETVQFLETHLGRNRNKWQWGRLHRYLFRHPGSRGKIPSWLFNRGPYPAGGSTATVNMANFNPAKKGGPFSQFEVTVVPSLRFITSLADKDSSLIMGPMGQSGRPGDPHYADMIIPWMNVEYIPLPMSRKKVEELSVIKTVLKP